MQFDCGTVSVPRTRRKYQINTNSSHVVRTGQPHRTLLGHTAPVTCLQFDEIHVVTGSLDKSLRVTVAPKYYNLWLTASLARFGTCGAVEYLKPSSMITPSPDCSLTVERLSPPRGRMPSRYLGFFFFVIFHYPAQIPSRFTTALRCNILHCSQTATLDQ